MSQRNEGTYMGNLWKYTQGIIRVTILKWLNCWINYSGYSVWWISIIYQGTFGIPAKISSKQPNLASSPRLLNLGECKHGKAEAQEKRFWDVFFRASVCPLASFGWWFESFQNLSFFLKFPHLVFRLPILGRFFKRISGQTQLTFLVNVGPGIALYVPWDPIEWFILYPAFFVSPKFIQDSNYIILYHLASHSTHCIPMIYFRSKMFCICNLTSFLW